MTRLHLAVVIDYDRGAVLASDVEQAIEEWLADDVGYGSRVVKATAVIVSQTTHDRLKERADA